MLEIDIMIHDTIDKDRRFVTLCFSVYTGTPSTTTRNILRFIIITGKPIQQPTHILSFMANTEICWEKFCRKLHALQIKTQDSQLFLIIRHFGLI